MGTIGAANGANICGSTAGPPCPTTATGIPIDLTSGGGNCLGPPANVPSTLRGTTAVLALPGIDVDGSLGDSIATLTLQCQ